MKLQEQERQQVFDYLHSVSAIALNASKDYLIEARLAPIATSIGARSFAELIDQADRDPSGALANRIVDAITTGETFFFRDQATFDLLRHKLIPELIERQNRSQRKPTVRIWCAACSTGQELYSIAMLISELVANTGIDSFRLLGTDISNEAIVRASSAKYNSVEMERGLSELQRSRHFQPSANGWSIRDELRAMTTFRRFNLTADLSGLGRFDIIFCRNVAIYFNEQDRSSLFTRIGNQLEPHGSLILGSMETLGSSCPQMESSRYQRAVCYRFKQQKAHFAEEAHA